MYITQKEKNEKLHMINKISSYSRRGVPMVREGKGEREGWVVVGGWGVERERARMELGRLRKIYEGRERVKGK